MRNAFLTSRFTANNGDFWGLNSFASNIANGAEK